MQQPPKTTATGNLLDAGSFTLGCLESNALSMVLIAEFEKLTGTYTLENGILRTKDVTLTKAEGTVTASGALGLLDSSLNFDVVAKLGRATVEAKLAGTTAQPIVIPKLGRLQRKIEGELDKALPGGQSQGLKDLFKGLFGR